MFYLSDLSTLLLLTMKYFTCFARVKFCLENRLHVEEFDAVLNPSITVGALKLLASVNLSFIEIIS